MGERYLWGPGKFDVAGTLILFAHPAFERSRVGAALLAAASSVADVAIRDLYALYPDVTIDVGAEQAALAAADRVILQCPLHWYSVPALLKEWLDLVLTHNWAYGAKGRALEHKLLACALSAAGAAHAYGPDGSNRYTIAEFLRPLEQTASLCRMRWHEPFVAYNAATLSADQLAKEAMRYADWLTALVETVTG